MDMQLDAYLRRISYDGAVQPDHATLKAIHRAHLYAIPYENLDIHLGRELSLDLERTYDKIVNRRRGGWCYEMNGLLAWALREIGFEVTLLASDVGHEFVGDGAGGEHLILKVDLDQPYLADVGFGNGILEPIPLEPGAYTQGFLTYRLQRAAASDERAADERWFFQNHAYGGAGFVFTTAPRASAHFAPMCRTLQTSPESGFVRTTVCHRFTPEGLITLRGSVLRTITEQGVRDETVENSATYEQILRSRFDLRFTPDEIDALWAKVWARHQAWVAENG